MTAKRSTILLVEDEQTIIKIISRDLSKSGYDVVSAVDPNEAFAVLDSKGIDLILLDIILPQMDGVEFLQKLRASKKPYRNIQVIVFSNLDVAEKKEEFSGLNIAAYLVKEHVIGTDILLDTIQSVLKR